MPKSLRERVKESIAAGFRPERGQREALCRAVRISTRTYRRWQQEVANGDPPRRLGRPPHSEEKRAEVLALVRAELAVQGASAGRGAIVMALAAKKISARLIQEALRKVKSERRSARRLEEAKRRVSMEVLARDAVWAEDSTQIEAGPVSSRPEAEVIRDAGTTTVVAARLRSGPATSENVIGVLEKAMDERGCAPLVHLSDNGAANVAEATEAFLRSKKIVHLKTLPHTPKHNAVAERANGELKCELEAAGRDENTTQDDLDCAAACLGRKLRASRGWQNAETLDKTMPPAYALVSRAVFYSETVAATERAMAGLEKPRDRRLAERQAIIETMVRFGLIQVTVGGRAAMVPEADRVS